MCNFQQQHLEDKHLSRFLEAEEIDQDHLRNGAAASGASQ